MATEDLNNDEEIVCKVPHLSLEHDTLKEYFHKMPGLICNDYEQYFAHIAPKSQVLKRSEEKRRKQNFPQEQLNVLIIGMDSLSHLTYQRKLPKTYSYLKNTLGAVILHSYNILAEATLGTMIPMVTGMSEDKVLADLPNLIKTKTNKTYVDDLPLIWKKYEENGYVTMMGEDYTDWGTYEFKYNGFKEKPTDHYMRTFWLTADTYALCHGNKPKYKYQLDYVKNFFQKYTDVPKFGFSFHVVFSHNNNNHVEYVDNDLMKLLISLKDKNYLNNTVLMVMSDHGARFGKARSTPQGKLEEMLPMMSLVFPEWFKEKYKKYYSNLVNNVHKLSTPFDIHETLLDILNLTRLQSHVPDNSRAISLLQKIPANRTCASAGITVHWCTCLNLLKIDKNHQHASTAANLMVDQINSFISNHLDKCENLTLKEVTTAKLIVPDETLLKTLQQIDVLQRMSNYTNIARVKKHMFQIVATTSPNNGKYESVVEYNKLKEEWHVSGEISRINKYGNQPSCILDTHPRLRPYCYCKR